MSTSGNAFVNFIDVQKSYDGETLVVKDLNLAIRRGEFLTLLGPSGSGKTTTLMMLAGFEVPTHGRIELDGQAINDLAPHKRNIGMVFQNYALFPHMTAAKNVLFPLQMRRFPKPDMQSRVARILELVGLSRFAERYPRELSGGQQQRVALARALVFDPAVLLLDEPLGALDKNLREQMQVEIKRIHREVGITMIYVTHDQTEAMTMSDRIAVFANGRLEQIGSPLVVYHRPANRFVGSFIGDSNFFAGRIDKAAPGMAELVGIGPVKIAASEDNPTGEVDILIRPERLRPVGPSHGPGDGADNIFDMTVDDVINYGDSLLAIGRTRGLPIRARIGGSAGPAPSPGQTIRLGWAATDAHIIARR
jgi:putative spermidine/putrescine transport system ATP-binding protein